MMTLFSRKLIILLSLFISCPVFAEPTMPKADFILPQVVKQWQAESKKFTLIDVREPEEFQAGHLPGAINIPYAQVEERMDQLSREIPQIIYCIHSSWRAPYVANLLLDNGIENVYVLEGGVSAWNAGGTVVYPTTSKKINIAPYPKDLVKDLKHPPARDYKTKIDLTPQQLKEFDGKNGRPAYVAVDGIIYDVTTSRLWRGGDHDPSHGEAKAGQDLSEALKLAPHSVENLHRFPVVGQLKP